MQVLVLAFTALVTVAGAGEPSILSIPSTPPAAGTRQISAPPCQTTCHVSSVECDTCDYEQERISVTWLRRRQLRGSQQRPEILPELLLPGGLGVQAALRQH